MSQQNKEVLSNVHNATVGKRMLQGAAIGLVLIVVFLLKADKPKPEWGELWMVRPLLLVPFAGAMAGVGYYFMDYLRCKGGWKKIVAYVLSFLGLVIALWIGIVVGLDGTYWD